MVNKQRARLVHFNLVVVSSSPIFSVHFALGKVIVELQKKLHGI